jgi:hypothetical protein
LVKAAVKDFLARAALFGKFMELSQPLLVEFEPCSCKLHTPRHFRESPNIHGMKQILWDVL